ncbi:MAG TPA: hypothetical protein VGH97_11785 [Thermoanaerobaculia bacterium]
MAAMEAMEPMDHWMTMVHAFAFLTYNHQAGPSGDQDFESQNHFMGMAIRRWAGGKLSLLATLSLEPATIPARGSPELFQRGETYNGVLLIDRQHPHDFFIQLAAAWERTILGGGASLRLELAPVGEPALGPTAYPHRLSASENPQAPLSHHNQDSTHIAYDVISARLMAGVVSLESSGFHGAEPDENRWNIQAGKIDSYSGRLTVRPLPELSLQFSAGHLEHPEALEPGDQTRVTASASYERSLPGGYVAATVATGRNQTAEGPEWGTLLEWVWKFGNANFLFGRLESVDRDVYELEHKRQRPESVPHQRTRVGAATFGYTRNFPGLGSVESGVGGSLTVYRFASRLDPVYGNTPVSYNVFVRLRYGTHTGMEMGHSHH